MSLGMPPDLTTCDQAGYDFGAGLPPTRASGLDQGKIGGGGGSGGIGGRFGSWTGGGGGGLAGGVTTGGSCGSGTAFTTSWAVSTACCTGWGGLGGCGAVTPPVGGAPALGGEPGEVGAVGDAAEAVPPAAGAPARGRARDLPTAFRILDVEGRLGPAETPAAMRLAVSIVPRPA